MTSSFTVRAAAALASFVLTFVLFDGVAHLAEPETLLAVAALGGSVLH